MYSCLNGPILFNNLYTLIYLLYVWMIGSVCRAHLSDHRAPRLTGFLRGLGYCQVRLQLTCVLGWLMRMLYVCIYVWCMYVCNCYIYMCVYVCMYVCTYVCMYRLLMDPVTAQKVKPIVYLYGLRDLVEDQYIPTSLVCMCCCIYVSECVRTDVFMYVCIWYVSYALSVRI